MRDLTFLIEDDRYTVPTLRLETLQDTAHPADAAENVLLESEHHLAVEVHDGTRMLIRRSREHLALRRQQSKKRGRSDPRADR